MKISFANKDMVSDVVQTLINNDYTVKYSVVVNDKSDGDNFLPSLLRLVENGLNKGSLSIKEAERELEGVAEIRAVISKKEPFSPTSDKIKELAEMIKERSKEVPFFDFQNLPYKMGQSGVASAVRDDTVRMYNALPDFLKNAIIIHK